jgi:uncharacterized protein with HEPN domain
MTEKGYGPHLAVMRDAIQAIERYRPADQATFLADPMCQDAVLMRLQVIGEHLGRLRQMDEERFFALADASWFQVIGLRNVISHGYEVIDFARIWSIISDDLPAFAQTLNSLSSD